MAEFYNIQESVVKRKILHDATVCHYVFAKIAVSAT